MNRRKFLKGTTVAAISPWLHAASNSASIDLKNCAIVVSERQTAREKKAITVLLEEIERRSGLLWKAAAQPPSGPSVVIYAGVAASMSRYRARIGRAIVAAGRIGAEGYAIQTGEDANGRWIALIGRDERGLLFAVGKFLRTIALAQTTAVADSHHLNIETAPKYPLRGHQLGYRPKTNAYDAWDVATWDRYIRDLAMFGTNAIELVPPRTDDAAESPHFPLPPEQMMIEMSRIADDYGLDVWIWYPAMDPDYADPATVESALKEWAHIYEILPRIDAILVPGGDPGHTAPKPLLAFLEKQKSSLRRFHPKAQMWVSPQSFRAEWLDDFFSVLDQPHTAAWLDGIVFGPQSRLSLPELRQRLPKRYPIRFYPDITHSVECQFPAPEWDVALAMTEGRECINPRPRGEANILRRFSPGTIGFITYSEGCNDDVNKFVWSALGWDPQCDVIDALREFSRYFLGQPYAEDFAQGLLRLEQNWRGPLATNKGIDVTLSQFRDLEARVSPAVLEDWRFQQALYRAYYDASVRSRLIDEMARVQRATDLLSRVYEIGWAPAPLNIEEPPSSAPPNGQDPLLLLEEADKMLSGATTNPAGAFLSARVRELGAALFQSIRMQLAVTRYGGEAVVRGANLETLETPVTDIAWLRAQITEIRKLGAPNDQVRAIRKLLERTDPGPGGFYDQLGNPGNREHLVLGPGGEKDPEFRDSALTGFSYPDYFGAQIPMAWKSWAESLFDAPLKMQYRGLDSTAQYRVRVVYSGDTPRLRLLLVANEKYEIHPLMTRSWPPKPVEFDIPAEATSGGRLDLAWTREQGLGGNGRGTQVSEIWLIKR
jgi:hypothetical protein